MPIQGHKHFRDLYGGTCSGTVDHRGGFGTLTSCSAAVAGLGARAGRGRAHKQERQREAGQVERLVGLHAQRGPLAQETNVLLPPPVSPVSAPSRPSPTLPCSHPCPPGHRVPYP